MADYKKTIDFIKSVYGNKDFTPLAIPVFAGNEKKYLNECIDTTFVSSVGKFVDRFEEEIAKYTGAKRAVVCVNGTNALHMSLLLAGVKQDDEVLTQALTFIATCNALSYIGAYPVFIDVDRFTMGLSPDALKEWLTKNAEVRKNTRVTDLPKSQDFVYEEDKLACYNKNTGRRIKACIPMHTFGHPVRIEEIAAICKEWHIELVEDAAESIGSTYKGKHTGTFGKVGAISFNGNKTITTGGGGMLLFNDEELSVFAKHLTTQAKIPHRWEFRHDYIGYNYRMPNINAALGCAQLENLDRYITSKREVAAEYEAFFKNIPDIEFFVDSPDTRSNYWLNAIILKDKEAQLDFLEQTNDNGVMTRPIWELMNRLPIFENCESDSLKNTIWFADRVVNIPSSVRL
ncbi:LegC family aminotransferase [Butyricimonas paravirosa]|uniref:LegC family aminotransferase n=1 Tax=Butyricimonas paravirosa TaxID=1472417 RepID=UPI00210CE568|nr:LegC family aminotransferase [Butyricimonas paravirosa]MCQ4875160.1 LegC family aminotransferase [Butyricimonas paravirosa]